MPHTLNKLPTILTTVELNETYRVYQDYLSVLQRKETQYLSVQHNGRSTKQAI
jgi:hypothetical protein